jgi:hypothetical protein
MTWSIMHGSGIGLSEYSVLHDKRWTQKELCQPERNKTAGTHII